MPTDATAMRTLLDYDSGLDWRARWAREGPFQLGALAGEPFALDLSEEMVLVAN